MVGVAVNVTDAPEQIEVDDALIDTDGVTELEVIVIALLIAVVGTAQAALDIMITVTRSLLLRELEIKFGELVPAFTPFTCH